jgi:hypothetical protein
MEGSTMNPISEADALLRGHAHELHAKFDDTLEDTRSRLTTQVQDHPLRTMLFAVGAGVLLGLALGLGKKLRRD